MAAEDGTPSIDSELQETLKLPFEQFIEQIKSQHEQVYRFISFLHLQVLRLDPDSPFQEEGLNEKFIKYYGTYFYFKYYLDALEVRRCCIYTHTRFSEVAHHSKSGTAEYLVQIFKYKFKTGLAMYQVSKTGLLYSKKWYNWNLFKLRLFSIDALSYD